MILGDKGYRTTNILPRPLSPIDRINNTIDITTIKYNNKIQQQQQQQQQQHHHHHHINNTLEITKIKPTTKTTTTTITTTITNSQNCTPTTGNY